MDEGDSDADVIAELAAMDLLSYERGRKRTAKAMHVRVSVLDLLVQRSRVALPVHFNI